MRWMILLALAGCSAAKSPTADAPSVEAPADSGLATLHGQRLAAPRALPEFNAVANDGTPRTREDLLGHPTVVWFFPVAGTPG
jgi:cytochrome oxidase Cu insertion factor (SCO1/SenC/PrrC family)